jgi:hypothetical protein
MCNTEMLMVRIMTWYNHDNMMTTMMMMMRTMFMVTMMVVMAVVLSAWRGQQSLHRMCVLLYVCYMPWSFHLMPVIQRTSGGK